MSSVFLLVDHATAASMDGEAGWKLGYFGICYFRCKKVILVGIEPAWLNHQLDIKIKIYQLINQTPNQSIIKSTNQSLDLTNQSTNKLSINQPLQKKQSINQSINQSIK